MVEAFIFSMLHFQPGRDQSCLRAAAGSTRIWAGDRQHPGLVACSPIRLSATTTRFSAGARHFSATATVGKCNVPQALLGDHFLELVPFI